MASREQALAHALGGLDNETRQALARALERGEVELEGGDWGSVDDGSDCLLSLAAWELGLERGESLMRRSVAAVQVSGPWPASPSSIQLPAVSAPVVVSRTRRTSASSVRATA